MKDWLQLFFDKTKDISLTIKDKTYHRCDFEQISEGSEKQVYKLKNEKLCFFIPNKYSSEDDWNRKILLERSILDAIGQLGLKVQEFEPIDIEINAPGMQTDSIKGLLAKDFISLCEEESIAIYDPKKNKVTGTPPLFLSMQERFKNKEFIKQMFQKIIKEYAVAFTFRLPISNLKYNDDSEHFIFELSKDSNQAPTVRYMFWDVVSDTPKFPFVLQCPTLVEFKKGLRDNSWQKQKDIAALNLLANRVSVAISNMGYPDDLFLQLQANIVLALNDDAYLENALDYAKTVATQYGNKVINTIKKESTHVEENEFISYICLAISTANLDLVKAFYQLRPQDCILREALIDQVLNTAKQYENPSIINFIDEHLGIEKNKYEFERLTEQNRLEKEALKNTFLGHYTRKLDKDKSSYCGIYSFFATSYVNKDMTLEEIVEHARGLSKQGTGKRSRLVMKELGFLDNNDELNDDLRRLIPC